MAGKKRKNRKSNSVSNSILALFGLITAFVFLPTTIMLAIALLPTLAAGLSDRLRGETRALTIGSMNMAGCTPYLLQLWSTGHQLENALTIIIDPRTIIVIYSAAAVGWIIDWAMSGIVATIMQQRGIARLKEIKSRHAALVERWGPEVTGDMPLDSYGFPITDDDDRLPPPKPARTNGSDS